MKWILESLFKVFLGILDDIITYTTGLVTGFKLDIGTSPGYFKYLYREEASEFNNTFYYVLKPFQEPFLVLALGIIIFVTIFKLYQSMGGPFTESEPPGTIMVRSFLAGVGSFYSYKIFVTVEAIFNEFYKLFVNVYTQIGNNYKQIDEKLLQEQIDSGWTDDQFQKTYGRPKDELADGVAKVNEIFSGGHLYEGDASLGETILTVIICCTLVIVFFRLLLEVYERYVILAVMYYTAPLAFATLVSKSSSIFKNWMQMFTAQFILMSTNLFFLGGFIGAWNGLLNRVATGADFMFATKQEFFAVMFLLIGWLVVGQKMDEHLRSVGLSVAQTGQGLYAAMAGGAALAKAAWGATGGGLMKAASKGIARRAGKAIGNTASDIGGKIESARAAKEAAKESAQYPNGKDPEGLKKEAHMPSREEGPQNKSAGMDAARQNSIDSTNQSWGEGIQAGMKNSNQLPSEVREAMNAGTLEAPQFRGVAETDNGPIATYGLESGGNSLGTVKIGYTKSQAEAYQNNPSFPVSPMSGGVRIEDSNGGYAKSYGVYFPPERVSTTSKRRGSRRTKRKG